MYSFLIAFFTAALGLGFWFDNEISHAVFRYWWVFLLAGYPILCFQLPQPDHRYISRFLLVAGTALVSLLCVWVFDDVLTAYLIAAIYLTAWSLGRYAAWAEQQRGFGLNYSVIALVALALASLPVSINRVLVKLPNLSAGTTITLYERDGVTPDLDARFYNRMNDHLEIEAYLGSQIYFSQPHVAPKLRIETTIPDVVVRLLSVSYQHRLAYLDLPLFEITGDDLLQIELAEDSHSVRLEKDRVFLLVSGFVPGHPVWLQLPYPDHLSLTGLQLALVIFFRLLLLGVLGFAVFLWAPRPSPLIRGPHVA